MINVTQCFLPPIEEYQEILKSAWDEKWITNRGKLLLELESQLSDYLKVDNFFITTNGTLPLQIALKTLGVTKEVITTPFSYVATTSSIVWEGCKPVFCDIDSKTLNIDINKIELLINDNTEAIMVTHVFGNPCDIDAIDKIAKRHNLKVIYDGAHCFGVEYGGKSIFAFGDIVTTSFHATKLFHTGEGGALFSNNKKLFEKAFYHHNFGHNGPLEYHGLGINAKATEMQASMGLAVLPYMDKIMEKRKKLSLLYEDILGGEERIELLCFSKKGTRNYSYFPLIFESEILLLLCIERLNAESIFPRRYFYPSLNKLSYLEHKSEMRVSEDISKRILCLPLYYELEEVDVIRICNIIKKRVK